MQRWWYSAPNLKKKATKSKRKCNQIHLLKSATRNIIFCLVDFGAPTGQNDTNTSACVLEVSKRNITFLNKAVCRTYSSLSLKNVAGV